MNHIQRLQMEKANAAEESRRLREGIADFRVHLSLDKFTGLDAEGTRKDWIAVSDVLRWLDAIEQPSRVD